jgi:hypothetical protein
MKLKSHASHLMREQTLPSGFHSPRKEASLGQPTQIRQLTNHLTKRITKTSLCHATKICMVYSLPCIHCNPPSAYLPKIFQIWADRFLGICNGGSHVSGTFRQWADTIGGLRDSNMRCHSELHIRFRVRIRLSPHSCHFMICIYPSVQAITDD